MNPLKLTRIPTSLLISFLSINFVLAQQQSITVEGEDFSDATILKDTRTGQEYLNGY